MKIITTKVASERWGISERRVQILCSQGRVLGAQKIGSVWVIPDDATKPIEENHIFTERNTYYLDTLDKTKNVLKREIKHYVSYLSNSIDEKFGLRNKIHFEIIYALFCRLGYPKNSILSLLEKVFSVKRENIVLDGYFNKSIRNTPFSGLTNLISWSYEYLNELFPQGHFVSTQFFTEEYMAISLLEKVGCAGKCIDPCCGGGNFLALLFLEKMKHSLLPFLKEVVKQSFNDVVGFDADPLIIPFAYCNLVFETCKYSTEHEINLPIEEVMTWSANIFYPLNQNDEIGSLASAGEIRRFSDNKVFDISVVLSNANTILTNPPFATRKGMSAELSRYLKREYPLCNCDLSASFLIRTLQMLNNEGQVGIVCQNTWLFLKSLSNFRNHFLKSCQIYSLVELGSGAFKDLNGEKSSVCLLTFKQKTSIDSTFEYLDASKHSYLDKRKVVFDRSENLIKVNQNDFIKDSTTALQEDRAIKLINRLKNYPTYKEFGVAMQGTSVGKSDEAIGYFWEHFSEPEWKLVSKGGGYSRYAGLNNYVVMWNNVKSNPKAVIRNEKYFPVTKLAFSDTGTNGLNVRLLLPEELFVASGPGIRVLSGNVFAHLAYLNSRLPSLVLQVTTPKLTIAAGYINALPFSRDIANSERLSELGKHVYQKKVSVLSCRPNQYEYRSQINMYKGLSIRDSSLRQFKNDVESYLDQIKAGIEIENTIFNLFDIPSSEQRAVSNLLGPSMSDLMNETDKILNISRLDSLIESLLSCDCLCCKSKIDKRRFGSDNLLEYLSRYLLISPSALADFIIANASSFKKTMKKYDCFIIHNVILDILGYSPEKGIVNKHLSKEEIFDKISKTFLGFEIDINSIFKTFSKTHGSIFMNRGFANFNE